MGQYSVLRKVVSQSQNWRKWSENKPIYLVKYYSRPLFQDGELTEPLAYTGLDPSAEHHRQGSLPFSEVTGTIGFAGV